MRDGRHGRVAGGVPGNGEGPRGAGRGRVPGRPRLSHRDLRKYDAHVVNRAPCLSGRLAEDATAATTDRTLAAA